MILKRVMVLLFITDGSLTVSIFKAKLRLTIPFELPPVSFGGGGGGGILMRLPVKYPELVKVFKEARPSRNLKITLLIYKKI
jgi:hypothetical protein